jgi:hypothetical protein
MKAEEIPVLREIPLSDSSVGAPEKAQHNGSAFEEQGTKRFNPSFSKGGKLPACHPKLH